MDKVTLEYLNHYNLLRKKSLSFEIGMVLEGVFPQDIRVKKI